MSAQNATEPPLCRLANRRAVSIDELPVLPAPALGEALASAVASEWRIVTLFGVPERESSLRLVAVLADDARGRLGAVSSVVERHYPSLAMVCRQAARFEREIAEQCGAIPEGHPSLKPLRRHPPDHAPAAWRDTSETDERGAASRDAYVFTRVAGDEVHEVAVGPVHAGVIEPGHFRFQAHGEEVLSLEIVLGYQHRGVERLLESADRTRSVLVAESIAGDSVIAHASAFCGVVEALARSQKSPRAQAIRGIALELERLANHIGDLGALAGDVAYQPAAAFFGRLRGECLNLLMTISGNRYGRGLVRPGGVAFDIPPAMAREVVRRVERLREELRPVAKLFFDTASVQSRLEDVGVVTGELVRLHGFVGPVARSCDVPRDVRHDHAYGVYRFAQIPVATAWAGDAFARALVRWLEVQRSIEFVLDQVSSLPRGDLLAPCGALRPGELVVALEEGWRGEVAHVALTDDAGRLRRHKVTDPSFHNWAALALAMPGNQISDFPLCNKSFNLSYAGHDL
ncbi:MAG TPA: NADH-quinone oxidoreductase subunit C [Gemmatimonadaceae bacterium]|nr:NADH-quinone oxidoreductase subunit C [Gemmatimonadaceae bacterium]